MMIKLHELCTHFASGRMLIELECQFWIFVLKPVPLLLYSTCIAMKEGLHIDYYNINSSLLLYDLCFKSRDNSLSGRLICHIYIYIRKKIRRHMIIKNQFAMNPRILYTGFVHKFKNYSCRCPK